MAETVKLILEGDTLESGFRVKYNETANQIITGYTWPAAAGQQPTGQTLRLTKFGGGYIDIDINRFFYTKTQITQVLQGIAGSPYIGTWSEAEASTSVYTSGTVVDYNGLFWKANADTLDTDVPGVSNKWDTLLTPTLPVYDITKSYIKDATVRKLISGAWYQFASQNDNNATEPSLIVGIIPWSQVANAVYGGSFVPASIYLTNQAIVDGLNIYQRKATASPIGGDPQPSTDTSHVYWIHLGPYKDLWSSGYVGGYAIGDIAIDGSNNVFASNIGTNSEELDALSSMQWDLIGLNINTITPALKYIPAGSANPFPINTSVEFPQFGFYFKATAAIQKTGLANGFYYPPEIEVDYVLDQSYLPSAYHIVSLLVFGYDNPSNPGFTNEDMYVLLTTL